jgi:hypothetical protein
MPPQNAAEFWNVCTRPATSRGGFGFSIDETVRKLRLIERLISVRAETEATYQEWKQFDARIVAGMKSHGITHLLTLNGADFKRFSPLVTVMEPSEIS